MTRQLNIALLMGVGNNECAWARILSRHGRVTLILRGNIHRVEVWQYGKLLSRTPNRPVAKHRFHNLWFLEPYGLLHTAGLARRLCCRNGEKLDLVVGTSNILGGAALLLRSTGHARRAVSLLQDYFPPVGSLSTRLWRRYHAASARAVAMRLNEVWLVSPRNPIAEGHPSRHTIPIYIDELPIPDGPRHDVAYIGLPSADHALDTLFSIALEHDIGLQIVGDSPYLDSLRPAAPSRTRFHGFLTDPERVSAIFGSSFCGYAVYRARSPTNYSYFGVPSKLFNYLANGLPVVTTDTAAFSRTIEERGLGHVVEPSRDSILQALLAMQRDYPAYRSRILEFRREWNEGVERFLGERLSVLV